ncbi:MAG TPA: phytochelatin synthase family protein [Steroidobacteraceae bacterium]|jgi:glutathione gamma-glutamylcysteinyltransferase|nr:phytochelatin synthase family protein [Steroidobacteraceae bacterium]
MRLLPADLPALDSAVGRELFGKALVEGTMQGYFRLAQQFHTQSDPAFCGLGSLVCALNALQIDPRRKWKGVWRWFSEELLDCCKSLDEIRQLGLTLDEVACLAACSAASVSVHRPPLADISTFREHLRAATTIEQGPVLIVNYSRKSVGQSGDGHFSPIAALHVPTDRVLVLDTARFKYPPHWIPVELLYSAMTKEDPATGQARGWLLLRR